ncbi:MAG: nicotinic acid mononucleotide adenylyltransferase, partial [Shimia sp.]
WQDWRGIAARVPLGILARPGERTGARVSKAARVLRKARLQRPAAKLLGRADPPAWCFINVPMDKSSSSALRAQAERREA